MAMRARVIVVVYVHDLKHQWRFHLAAQSLSDGPRRGNHHREVVVETENHSESSWKEP